MSTKKDKLLDSAQKFIAKGQLDRAIKDYEQIVSLDPDDIRFRQKLAELLVRANRKIEAIQEYESIGKHYSDNAFYLKAIAVYKQIQKLDAGDVKTTLTLAALNEKQGLIGNALAEYNTALGYFQKAKELPEAVNVLEQMLATDPENLNTHLKYAETYYHAGVSEKSYEKFIKLAVLIGKNGDESAFRQTCNRVASLFPGRTDFLQNVAAALVEEGDVNAAIPLLRQLTHSDRSDRAAWDLLAEAYRRREDMDSYRSTLRQMASLFPDILPVDEPPGHEHPEEGEGEEILETAEAYEPMTEIADDGEIPEVPAGDVAYGGIVEGLETDHRSEAAGERQEYTGESLDALLQEETDRPEEPPTETGRESASEEEPPGPELISHEEDWEEEIDLSLLEEGGSEFPLDLGADVPVFGPVEEADLEAGAFPPTEFGTDGLFAGAPEASQSYDHVTEISLELGEEETEFSLDSILGEAERAATAVPELRETEAALPEPTTGGNGEELAGSLPPFREMEEFLANDTDLFNEEFGEEIGVPETGKTDKYGLDGLFSEFKEGVGRQLDQDDTETHYNLGIAYKEMGLYDDAIAEFQVASLAPGRGADCLLLQGICYRDKGDDHMAEEAFRAGIALENLSVEEVLSLKYELALFLENSGRPEEALELYHEVRASDSGFRDVVRKVALLGGGEEESKGEDMELLELDLEQEE